MSETKQDVANLKQQPKDIGAPNADLSSNLEEVISDGDQSDDSGQFRITMKSESRGCSGLEKQSSEQKAANRNKEATKLSMSLTKIREELDDN